MHAVVECNISVCHIRSAGYIIHDVYFNTRCQDYIEGIGHVKDQFTHKAEHLLSAIGHLLFLT